MSATTDRALAAELLTTIAAALDLAVTAADPETDHVEAARLRRVAHSQLSTAGRLLNYQGATGTDLRLALGIQRAGRAKIDLGAAAGT